MRKMPKMKKFPVSVPPELHRKFKTKCAAEGINDGGRRSEVAGARMRGCRRDQARCPSSPRRGCRPLTGSKFAPRFCFLLCFSSDSRENRLLSINKVAEISRPRLGSPCSQPPTFLRAGKSCEHVAARRHPSGACRSVALFIFAAHPLYIVTTHKKQATSDSTDAAPKR